MIKKLTNHILKYLISSNVIENVAESRDYYQYGIEITISSLLNILLIVTIGIVSGNILESIVFLACFVPLRQFTGGFHAKTYFLCNLSFSISFVILLTVYRFTNQYVTPYIGFSIILFSCIIFFSECPIENKNKIISKEKKKIHKAVSIILCAFYGITGMVLTIFSYKIGVILLYTLVLILLLVIIATFQDMIKKMKVWERQTKKLLRLSKTLPELWRILPAVRHQLGVCISLKSLRNSTSRRSRFINFVSLFKVYSCCNLCSGQLNIERIRFN